MEVEVNHYGVLGLPSGDEGAKLTEKEISKAYKFKALELHPDKRPDDPNAHANFQKLKSSYEILKDEKARKLFDDLLRIKREKHERQSQQDSKRRKMVSDLESRERAACRPEPKTKACGEEERIARKLQEEIARIKAMQANKSAGPASSSLKKEDTGVGKQRTGVGGVGLNKEKMLKVSWEKGGLGYTAERLREVFAKFGVVEDVVINRSKSKCSALVVMASKDAAVAATRNLCGDLSNPLLVLPVQPGESPTAQKREDTEHVSNIVGTGHQAFENSVLEKLKKAAEKQKRTVAAEKEK